MEEKIDKLELRMEKLEKSLERLDRLIESFYSHMRAEFKGVNVRLDRIEGILAGHEARISRLETRDNNE